MKNQRIIGMLAWLFISYTMAFSHPAKSATNSDFLNVTADTSAISVYELQRLLKSGAKVQVLDVRLPKDASADPQVIPTASWQDPNQVDQWAKLLSKDISVVVYCVYGHRISQEVAKRLGQLGYSVHQLTGGIAAWKAVGGTTVPFKK